MHSPVESGLPASRSSSAAPAVSSRTESFWSQPLAVAYGVAAVAIVLQMATNGRYGYFRDELYFIATSHHLAFGYVDFAPLAAWILRASQAVFGDSLHALRLLPALAYGGEIVLTGMIARELGGRRFAVLLASLGVLLAPVIAGNANRYSMNCFEPLFWMGAIYFVLLAINQEHPKWLIWSGVLIGLGLENKHSTAFFLIALLVGLAASYQRIFFRSRWLWVAAAIIAVLALPNLIWQVQHGFPTWVDLTNVKRTHKNIELPPLPFIREQIMMLHPVNALIWIAGLGFLFLHPRGKRYRVLGVTYLVFLAILMVLHGKDYYLAPIYPMLFAAGSVFWETLTNSRQGLRWMRVALPAAVTILGVLALPLVLPILPVDKVVPYSEALGIKNTRTETHHSGPLPQHFGDEFGWPEMVAAVASVYNAMPADDRAKTAILAGNYGEAGAIDFFGARYGLPKSISAHQNYYFWGPRNYTGESLILLQWSLRGAREWCRDVQIGPRLDPYWAMEEEHYNILICHGFKEPLSEAWPELKHWN
ncbi:MAG TPA: glycosyltransferase family 39 protein [Terriglobales bacterium]|nr:glycosyltransferase family 39 protein [Terriglobales bacterium]